MNTKDGKLLVLVGCSASGKDTLLNDLVELKIALPVVSHTSRPMRPGEVEGVNYFYVSTEEIKKMLDEGGFIESREYETIDGNGNKTIWYYGVSKQAIGNLDFKRNNYVVIVDFEGFKLLKDYMKKEGLIDNLISVFIKANSQIRLKRSLDREGELSEGQVSEIIRRFLDDNEKVEPGLGFCDLVLKNETLSDLSRNRKILKALLQ